MTVLRMLYGITLTMRGDSMQTQAIFSQAVLGSDRRIRLSSTMSIEIAPAKGIEPKKIIFNKMGYVFKIINFSDQTARRLLVADACESGAKKSRLAKALNMSRTTIDNIIKTNETFGVEGLVHQYNHRTSKDRRTQRRLHQKELSIKRKPRVIDKYIQDRSSDCAVDISMPTKDCVDNVIPSAKLVCYDKSVHPESLEINNPDATPECETDMEVHECDVANLNTNNQTIAIDQIVAIDSTVIMSDPNAISSYDASSITHDANHDNKLTETVHEVPSPIDCNQDIFEFAYKSADKIRQIPSNEQIFSEKHDYIHTRYAGTLIYLITLIHKYNWLRIIMNNYMGDYIIFMVFSLLMTHDIASIEQMKNTSSREAGVALGIKTIGNRHNLWKRFHSAADLELAAPLLTGFFKHQAETGLVDIKIMFVDGHTLPYTGKERVRLGFSTQRGIVIPARTVMVTTDATGKFADYEIQEGKGDLRGYIGKLGKKWKSILNQATVYVFDREGDGNDFFCGLVTDKTAFVTWEKGYDSNKLDNIDESKYIINFEHNGKSYSAFEGIKVITDNSDNSDNVSVSSKEITLRRIYLWNKSSKRKTCVIAWTGSIAMTTEECARAMLNRWAASENTFKHIMTRHPWHYSPGLKFEKSDRQDIANPQIKIVSKKIELLNKKLAKSYKQLCKTKEAVNADGTMRKNSVYEQLQLSIAEDENELSELREDKKQLPLRVDISTTGSERPFVKIADEGKKMFDLMSIPAWNARKIMVEMLSEDYTNKNDVVDELYAIASRHGWIKVTAAEIIIRLEPLEQPKRRHGQEELCSKLTSMMARTPNGKRFVVEVGGDPKKKCPQK